MDTYLYSEVDNSLTSNEDSHFVRQMKITKVELFEWK